MGCVNLVASFRRKYIYLIDTRFLSSRCFAPLLPLLLCAWRSVILISSTLDKMLLGRLFYQTPQGSILILWEFNFIPQLIEKEVAI